MFLPFLGITILLSESASYRVGPRLLALTPTTAPMLELFIAIMESILLQTMDADEVAGGADGRMIHQDTTDGAFDENWKQELTSRYTGKVTTGHNEDSGAEDAACKPYSSACGTLIW